MSAWVEMHWTRSQEIRFQALSLPKPALRTQAGLSCSLGLGAYQISRRLKWSHSDGTVLEQTKCHWAFYF